MKTRGLAFFVVLASESCRCCVLRPEHRLVHPMRLLEWLAKLGKYLVAWNIVHVVQPSVPVRANLLKATVGR